MAADRVVLDAAALRDVFHPVSAIRRYAAAVLTSAVLVACSRTGSSERTLGFAVISRLPAVYETKYMEECPEGLTLSNYAIWWMKLSREERAKVGAESAAVVKTTGTRGPDGEDVCWNPTVVKDPPLRTIEGHTAFGMNLDGDENGGPTPKSCPHENFTSPEGVRGVDNQLYRVIGCIYGWRRHGYVDSNADVERRDTSKGIMLIEVSQVDDSHNDEDVRVVFYKKADEDPLPKNSEGKVLPFSSYRVDPTPRYGGVTRGKITDGILTTEPVDMRWPSWGNESHTGLFFRDLRLRIPVSAESDSVKGMIAAYYDLRSWWDFIAKAEVVMGVGHYSCPAMFEAAHRLADGFPDPETGNCTAISSAFHIEAVPSYLIHEPQ